MLSIRTAAAIAAALVTLAAPAQDLVQNGRFDQNAFGWTPFHPDRLSVTWSPNDASGSNSSGSLLATITAPEGLNTTVYQCVTGIQSGAAYDAAAHGLIPPGLAKGQAFLYVTWRSTANCSSIISTKGVQLARDDAHLGKWQSVSLTGLVAPAGAVAATVDLKVIKNDADVKVFQAHFDDVLFGRQTPVTVTVPASASVHGQNQTFFQTDLWVMNCGRLREVEVTAVHRCFAGSSCAPGAKTFRLQPRESRRFQDVLGTFFGDPETAGAIELTWNSQLGEVAAFSRTYTPSFPAPTYGTSIPASAASEARRTTLFLGVAGSAGRLDTGFRSNAGVYNPNASPVEVTFTLSAGDGTPLGSLTRTLQAHEPLQVNDVFSAVGAGAVETTNATLVVTTNEAPVFAYVTVIDNLSADPIWLEPFEDEVR